MEPMGWPAALAIARIAFSLAFTFYAMLRGGGDKITWAEASTHIAFLLCATFLVYNIWDR